MSENALRYKEMEKYMTYGLIGDAALFVLYLIFAGLGIIWLKVILLLLVLILSGLILAYLYMTKELMRPRSMWMSVAAAAIAVCLLASLILNFPSPKYELPADQQIVTGADIE